MELKVALGALVFFFFPQTVLLFPLVLVVLCYFSQTVLLSGRKQTLATVFGRALCPLVSFCCPIVLFLSSSLVSFSPLGVLFFGRAKPVQGALSLGRVVQALSVLLATLPCSVHVVGPFETALSGRPLLRHAAFCSGMFSCGSECNSGAVFQI